MALQNLRMSLARWTSFALGTAVLGFFACSAPPVGNDTGSDKGNDGGTDSATDSTSDLVLDGTGTDTGSPDTGNENPATCAEAASARSYVGCDFWPTVTANPVWLEFDFAVVVANGGTSDSDVTISGPAGFAITVTVKAGTLETIKLPWVSGLKGPEFDIPKTTNGRLAASLSMEKGAYHLVASTPVTVWQFNPLEYRKDRADCGRITAQMTADATECRAASNDASLLLPSTAMTGNYRVGGYSGARGSAEWGSVPGGIAITATEDGTHVDLQLPPNCDAVYNAESNGCVVAGGIVSAGVKNQVLSFDMNQGDVVEILGAYGPYPQIAHADLAGSLINATKPIQTIAFNAIVNIPDEIGNADHTEETVLPAEVIGNKYIVVPPTAYGGAPRGHIVRIYGNVNGTKLTYPEGKPAGAPDTIDAGQVVEIPARTSNNQCPALNDTCFLTTAFVVEGDQPFAVNSFQVGGRLQVPNYVEQYAEPGDPAATMIVTPEQFRKAYTFLAPADFLENYADILVPDGAEVTLDGSPLSAPLTAIGASGWSVARAKLSGDGGGIHTLSTTHDSGLGVQVMGYGSATSFAYPGGLNLKRISKPPTVVK